MIFTPNTVKKSWIPLYQSISFIFKNKKVLSWSLILTACTIIITAISYHFMTGYVDSVSKEFFSTTVNNDSWWSQVKEFFSLAAQWLYHLGTHLLCFYLSFLLSYSLTSPGYCFLSEAVEKIYSGIFFSADPSFTLKGVIIDLWEGLKLALLGVGITIIAFFVNFIPIIGQFAVITLYTLYSTLLFIDYPAAKRRWSLRQKYLWIANNLFRAFRLGILPALVSLIPLINIFIMALLFPIMTVHATLNFITVERAKEQR